MAKEVADQRLDGVNLAFCLSSIRKREEEGGLMGSLIY